MEDKKELRIVDSKVHSLSEIFSASYTVDFYQREYVWQKKQFETMNDRGLSLTQIEMLRSYLLANIKDEERQDSMELYDQVISELAAVKLKKSKVNTLKVP